MRFFYTTFIVSIALATTVFTQQPQKTPDNSIQAGLPQRPVAPKERSDLEDEGIKGKVQTIKYETESSSGANAGKGRRLTRIEEFNEAGNKVSTSYVRDEVVTSILYYGYIDGTRVSKSDGRSGGSGSVGTGQVDTKPRDNRYELKRLYEYRNGKLIKETLISNDGSLTLTRKYNYRDGETEELVYDKNGKLNQKYITKYDKVGNEIEFHRFDVWKDPNKIAQKYRYAYVSFDSNGNWTQMNVSSAAGDSDVFSPGDTIYRSFAYYSDTKVISKYPAIWFAPINDPKKPDWEILPQEAKAGEVILSKRNELGILSNFAATPFELDGKRYASVEGFWQMMLYPEGQDDERAKDKRVKWKYTREQVAQMTAFEAKSAGTLAEENMKTLGIDWVTYNGKRFSYRSQTPGEHYKLIVAAMRAKLEQNPEVKRILLATGDLILKPDHHGEENPPPEWKYYEILMQLRSDLQKAIGRYRSSG